MSGGRPENIIQPAHEVLAAAAAKLNPEAFIGSEDMGLLKSAGITDRRELAWIAKIKSNDTGWNKEPHDREATESEGGKVPSEMKTALARVRSSLDGSRLNAYGLIRLHAMLGRDFKHRGPQDVSPSTERLLNRFIKAIEPMMHEERWKGNWFTQELPRLKQILLDPYWKAETPLQKAEVLQVFLTVFHAGGNPFGLEFFSGYQAPTEYQYDSHAFERKTEAAKTFLRRLNNLGHQVEGEFEGAV